MNLNEQRAALEVELAGLKSRVMERDAEAMKRASEILDVELPKIDERIKEAERFDGVMNRIGGMKKDGASARNLGEFVANAVRDHGERKSGERFSISSGLWTKAATDTNSTPAAVSGVLTDVREQVIEGERRELTIADLFGQETTTRSSITYFVEGAVEGSVTTVAEGAEKPQLHFADPTKQVDPVQKIAAWYRDTDELLDDLPWLASSIQNRAVYLVRVAEEDQLLNGNGSGNNIQGVLNRSGIQTLTQASLTGYNVADTIFRATRLVNEKVAMPADGIVINPADYETLRLSRDNNGQYYGGGYFNGQYGNGSVMQNPPLWGVRTVVTPAIAQGTVLVGAFRACGAVVRRSGLSVEMTNFNEDDFITNSMTIRIEERLALAVRRPAGFVKITLASD